MAIKNDLIVSLLLGLVVSTLISCSCKEDLYGENLDLIVPIQSNPNSTTFQIGDTIYWEADFSKEVEVKGHSQPIFLEGFDFFSTFTISEISSEEQVDFNRQITVVQGVGEIGVVNSTQNSYPVRFRETDDAYQLSFGVVLLEEGLYTAGLESYALPRDFNHPAAYSCGNRRRGDITIRFQNTSTDRQVFDTLYLSTPNPDLQELVDFERYRDYGGITFRVVP